MNFFYTSHLYFCLSLSLLFACFVSIFSLSLSFSPPPPPSVTLDVEVHVCRHQLPDLPKPQLLGPHPLPGHGPGAPQLDAQIPLPSRAVVVGRGRDAEEAVLAPGAAPRVAHDPVLDGLAKFIGLAVGVLDAPSDDGDEVVDLGLLDTLLEDAVAPDSLVAVELVGGVDAAGDGPAGKDLGLRKGRVALGMDEGEKGREEKR